MPLTMAIKIRIVLLNAKYESVTMVQRALKREKFTEYPSGASIREICKRFSDSGSIENRPRSGRPQKYEESEKSQITAILEEKPTSTLAEISAKVNMDRMTVSRFIHSEMGAKSYKIQIHQYMMKTLTDESKLPSPSCLT